LTNENKIEKSGGLGDGFLLKNEINQQLRDLFALQEERVFLLSDFETKFKEYLLDAPDFKFETLKHICKSVSDSMNDLSARILKIRQNFGADCFNVLKLFNLVNRLQEYEQEKFRLVANFFY
jgi:hypothetical protein